MLLRVAPHVLSLVVFLGCSGRRDLPSGSDTSQTTENATMDACYSRCKARAMATNCQPGGVNETYCRNGCDAIVPGLDETCLKKATVAYDCEAKAAWSCTTDGVPEPMDGGCSSMSAALASCFQGH